jgi:hypothetical protein
MWLKSLLIQKSRMFGVHKMKLAKWDVMRGLLRWEWELGSRGAGDQ